MVQHENVWLTVPIKKHVMAFHMLYYKKIMVCYSKKVYDLRLKCDMWFYTEKNM